MSNRIQIKGGSTVPPDGILLPRELGIYFHDGKADLYCGSQDGTASIKVTGGNYVTLDTTQTISASKTFSSNITMNGLLNMNNNIFIGNSSNPYIQLKENTSDAPAYYVQSYNNNLYLGPGYLKSVSIDANGNTQVSGTLTPVGGILNTGPIQFARTTDGAGGATVAMFKSPTTSAYFGFRNSSDVDLGMIGAGADKKPHWWDVVSNSDKLIPYSTDIPTQLSQLSTDTTHRLVTDTEKNRWNKSLIYYGRCSTAASTQAKTVTVDSAFTLVEGVCVRVRFSYGQSYDGAPTLNVNSTGAINVMQAGSTDAVQYAWVAGEVVDFLYDGTNWLMVDGKIATTTYYGVTKLSSAINSTSTALAATPSAVKQAYDLASTTSNQLNKIGYATLSVVFSGGHAYDVAVTGIKQNAIIAAVRLDTHTHVTGTWEMAGIGAIKATADGKVDIHQIEAVNGTWPIGIIYVNP